MATRYEYYTTGYNTFFGSEAQYWLGQTFTPSISHRITSVKVFVFRKGSPGTVTVSIRSTDGNGHPVWF